jgi:Flp pilus assembly protein TadD
MNKLSNDRPAATADVAVAPPKRRALRTLLVFLVVVGLAAAGFYAYRVRMPQLPEIPQVNLSDADPEVAAAITAARATVQSSPRSAKAWGNLAMLLHGNGFDDDADVCYHAAALLDPENPDWPYLNGYLHHAGSRGPERALPSFERAARLSSRDSIARVRLADMLLALGELDRAEQEYQQILAFNSAEPHARLGLAKVAVARGRLEESLRHLTPIANDPFVRNRACAMLANVHQQLGNQDLADQERQRLATLPEDSMRPDDPLER